MSVTLQFVDWDQVRRAAKRIHDATPGGGIHEVMLNEKQIVVTAEGSRGEISWSNITAVDFAPRHAFLFIGPVKGLIIPRGAVQDPAAFEALV